MAFWGHWSQPNHRSVSRGHITQPSVLPEVHSDLFKNLRGNREPTLLKSLGALGNPLGWEKLCFHGWNDSCICIQYQGPVTHFLKALTSGLRDFRMSE